MSDHRGVGRLRWRIREIAQTLWVRVAAFALLGLLTAVLGWMLRGRIPDALAGQIGADAIDSILQILASSMLTVTTFSLSILTAAYATASSGSTPRAVQLLVRDGVSQTVLATFMGAFVFSLVGMIMLTTQLYGEGGRVVLFVVTLLVIVVVILSLLRWINRLGELGLIGDNLTRVETVTAAALRIRLAAPWMGANPWDGAPPAASIAIMASEAGHIQNCDMQALSELAESEKMTLWIAAMPGDFVHPASPMFHASHLPGDLEKVRDLSRRLCACVTLRAERSFDQDPRFGFQVLSEIGRRALSPAVNDPGTAIAVTQRILRILTEWTIKARPEVEFPHLHVRSITPQEILHDNLLPLARDGAAMAEVHRALHHCLLALTRMAPDIYAAAAADLSAQFIVYSDQSIVLKDEKMELIRLSGQVKTAASLVVPAGPRDNP